MSPEPITLRFENTSPPHRKFYEVEVELSLFYPQRLVRRWGGVGSRRPRSIKMVMAGPEELARQVEVIARLRQQHGYQAVAEVRSLALASTAAVDCHPWPTSRATAAAIRSSTSGAQRRAGCPYSSRWGPPSYPPSRQTRAEGM